MKTMAPVCFDQAGAVTLELEDPMVTEAREFLFEWNHQRRQCSRPRCTRSVLWPIDEPSEPVCESCWDGEAEAVTREGRYIVDAEGLILIAAEMRRIHASPRGTWGQQMAELALRLGVTTRTLHRHARYPDLVHVEVFDRQAVFGKSISGLPIRRSPWRPVGVRCPKCGNLVRRADLEPCSALNHDVPDFRLVKPDKGGEK